MEDQTLSIQQMQHLKELGITKNISNTFRVRVIDDSYGKLSEICKHGEFLIKTKEPRDVWEIKGFEVVPTFTLQDILDLLPKSIITKDFHQDKTRLVLDFLDNNIGYAYYFETYGEFSFYRQFECCEGNMLDAAYQMLCWCIEQGYVETKKEE